MFKSICNVTNKIDKFKDVTKSLQELKNLDVLVGIPEAKSSRKSGEITNAELGYILSTGVHASDVQTKVSQGIKAGQSYNQALEAFKLAYGDPAFGIPARPFLEPSIEANLDRVTRQQNTVINAVLDGKDPHKEAEKLGLLCQNIVKSWFTDPRNHWPPNAPSTIAKKGSDRPNIDTGQLRNSITYVVRDKNSHA